MTEKELRRKSRLELIEIIAAQKQRELELMAQLEQLRQQLEDRRVKVETAGSIAEAALSLSGVFQAAQSAADMYLQSVAAAQQEMEDQRNKTLEECQRILDITNRRVEARLQETEKTCARMLAEAEKQGKK